LTAPELAVNVRGKGRHYKNPKTGKLVPSVTNILSVLDKPALPRWASLETAKEAAKLKASLPDMDDEEIILTLKSAPWRKADKAADRGTTIHEWLEKAMLGEQVPDLDGEAVEYEQAAHAWLDAYSPEPVNLEITMFSSRYAGTADGIVKIDGQNWLIDFKTSKGLYESAALQLAALYACPIVANGTDWQDRPSIDRVAAVRIGVDGMYDMLEVEDLDQHAKAFKACLNVWEWKKSVKPFSNPVEVPSGRD
jgi:hypothetical protein